MADQGRVVADCRTMPSDINCSLTIAGRIDEVLPVAVMHAVTAHGHEDTPQLREDVRATLKPESEFEAAPAPMT